MMFAVFAGPSVPPADRAEASGPDLIWYPPAKHGDLFKVAQRSPDAIGIVDGLFETTLSIWHKEILWALAQGISVWGAASMGAIRAAELHRYGMRGVGKIFEAYRDTPILDDADVAVCHGPAGLGFAAITEAMVDVQATMNSAVEQGVLDKVSAQVVLTVSAELHFKHRTWSAIIERVPLSIGESLNGWLPNGRVSQKQLDANLMIKAIRDHLSRDIERTYPKWSFSSTEVWHHAIRHLSSKDQK